jgi:alpha-galactosidase
MTTLLTEIELGDICAQYWLEREGGLAGLELMPLGWQGRRQPKKQSIDPVIQLMIRGDDFPDGFVNGHTMRRSASLSRFRYAGQERREEKDITSIITTLRAGDGQELLHYLSYCEGAKGVEVFTAYCNGSGVDITLDMLSSFCLGGITPFIAGDAPDSLIVHRLRSKWSNEARLDSIPVEDLQLEPTWSGYGAASERFGQVGSMPVRKFFPFLAVEDTVNHVLWGAQLACPSSWQMEIYRRDDGLCVSGGLPDYDFGHYSKTLRPGESLTTPTAYLSVCTGDIDVLCSRLLSMQVRALSKMELPKRLPVVFNEFCTTWGSPSQQNIERILSSLKDRDIDYFVIDAGWYADEKKGWGANMGDWECNAKQFPGGLASAVEAIRKAGLKPGIWFEPEVCGRDAKAFHETDHLLKRYGTPITTGNRRFFNMRDARVGAYLQERVIGLLVRYGFEYVKIDYNDSIGVGCDGAESLGEGLRQNQIASRAFLEHIRDCVPGILVENCSSGGHRLEPSFLGVCQLASFSDAHEEREIPIIAANLHRAMLPRQSLIWAVLRKDDSPKRLIWSLCATFLGVMCLSGDVYDLTPKQWSIVDEAVLFYRKVSHIIQDGDTVRHGPKVSSYRHPRGWQVIERTSTDGCEKLIVAHVFDESATEIRIHLYKPYRICGCFAESTCRMRIEDGVLILRLEGGACALHLMGE